MKVFKYGATIVGPGIKEQMRLGRKYYNALVEAENKRRQDVWGAEEPPNPPEHECAETCKTCKVWWAALRKRVRNEPPLDVKPLRKAAATGGLYWGTYNKMEEAFSAAWKHRDSFKTLTFRSWKQGGLAAIQVQNRGDAATRFIVDIAPDSDRIVQQNLERGTLSKRTGQRRTLRIRIGSNEKRKPIWCEPIPFIMHRQLTGRTTWIIVTMKHRGDRDVYSVAFVQADVLPSYKHVESPGGVVAIDVGWRLIPDGTTRIAHALGSDAREHTLSMPAKWAALTDKADNLRSIRDGRLNELKEVDDRFSRLKSCISARRRILELHKEGEASELLVAWAKRERHLWQYETGLRRRSEAKRKNDMRVWLRMLRNKYGDVVIKNSQHKAMKDTKRAKEAGMHKPARRRGHHCAPGEVIEWITSIWDRKTLVHVVSAVNTTDTCLECGLVTDHGAELIIECEWCGSSIDRDRASTRNMMNLFVEGEWSKPSKRKETARFAKRHKRNQVEVVTD